eukprot:9503066-Pyramimonas_sp.AAC.2
MIGATKERTTAFLVSSRLCQSLRRSFTGRLPTYLPGGGGQGGQAGHEVIRSDAEGRYRGSAGGYHNRAASDHQ